MNDPRIPDVDPTSNAYQELIGQTPAAFVLQTYTVTTLPNAARWIRGIIYVSNQSTGAEPAFSDGSNWRIFSTRAIVS